MTNDDERGEGGKNLKNAENVMKSYVNDPLFWFNFLVLKFDVCKHKIVLISILILKLDLDHYHDDFLFILHYL